MKVLFAVQDEQISTKIVKEYQKKYKEIISYKNIYYFNAILKELQRDKTYDRIIIDEELEEFNGTGYEQKNKFIFDKLDNISDEAINLKGQDIPIILICSEKRTKSEEIFVKLFGLGIYNALIGVDRSTEQVCKLIESPRSKKQAKLYYRIDSDEVQYRHEDENEVSEEEMQNILTHFKKLGKDEDKYVESFSKILKQYNQEQMKIIMKILPLNVRATLEEKSPEYQKIVSTNENMKLKVNKAPKEKGTVERLLKTENDTKKIVNPIVVPTTMQKNTVKKLSIKEPVKQYDIEEFDFEELVDEEEEKNIQEVEEIVEIKTKKRGRPKKIQQEEIEEKEPVQPKRRGRPRKVSSAEAEESQKVSDVEDEDLIIFQDEYEEQETQLPDHEESNQDEMVELPGFEEEDDDDEVDQLPGFEVDEEDDEEFTNLPGFGNEENEEDETTSLPGFEVDDDDDEIEQLPGFEEEKEELAEVPKQQSETVLIHNTESKSAIEEDNVDLPRFKEEFEYSDFENLLSADKKVVAFVGTSKNGTSFLVNNVAQYLSKNGIDTAILDVTRNKNSFYIYTKNDDDLRKTAADSMTYLLQRKAKGIRVNNSLSVYTSVPGQNEEMQNVGPILDTLVKNHSAILIDCDFDTPFEYFNKVQEIYLVQSMDVLTIQPLTLFLRDLKSKNLLDQKKIRILLNKMVKLRGITSKNIIGGMAFYNEPEMSFMTELFDRTIVKYLEIPFDEEVYITYLEGIVDCEINTNNYSKNFEQVMKELANMVYPLLPNAKYKKTEKTKKGYEYSSGFSTNVNNTLNNMKNRY